MIWYVWSRTIYRNSVASMNNDMNIRQTFRKAHSCCYILPAYHKRKIFMEVPVACRTRYSRWNIFTQCTLHVQEYLYQKSSNYLCGELEWPLFSLSISGFFTSKLITDESFQVSYFLDCSSIGYFKVGLLDLPS